jgi:hypothetical protein
VGVTTKTEIVQALGKPEAWDTDPDGSTHILYSYHMSTPAAAMMGMEQRVIVSFTCDSKRILTKIDLPQGP